MKRKILRFAFLLASISAVLTAALIHLAVYRSSINKLHDEAVLKSQYISQAVELAGIDYLRELGDDGVWHRVTLVDADGTVLFESDAQSERMENHADRPEITEAFATGVGTATRTSSTMSEQTYYYAVRLEDGTVLRVASATDSIYVTLLRLAVFSLFVILLIFLFAYRVGSRVTRAIVAPVNLLDLDTPEENDVYDELAPLLRRMKKQNDVIAEQMEDLRRKQTEFSALIANMQEGLLVLDPDGNVLIHNTSALGLLGAPQGFLDGQSALVLNRSEPFRLAVERAVGGEGFESVLIVQSGRHLQLIANPIRDEGAVRGALMILLDVTEQQNREQLRREFTANVSHELKTPLTSISGYAEIIAGGVAKSEDIPEFAQRIYTETQRLISLVDDIMMLSRLDEGAVSQLDEEVDLFSLAEDLLPRFEPIAAKKKVRLVLSGRPVIVRGHRAVLDEMLYNLVDNALKYSGGDVVEIAVKAGAHPALSVSDNGRGIPPAEQERVFERFYRIDKGRAASVEGTGLGLSIVKHGAALHSASIDLQSDGVSGTTITLQFPAQ